MKKQYIKPLIKVNEIKLHTNILAGSGDPDMVTLQFNNNNDPLDDDDYAHFR